MAGSPPGWTLNEERVCEQVTVSSLLFVRYFAGCHAPLQRAFISKFKCEISLLFQKIIIEGYQFLKKTNAHSSCLKPVVLKC